MIVEFVWLWLFWGRPISFRWNYTVAVVLFSASFVFYANSPLTTLPLCAIWSILFSQMKVLIAQLRQHYFIGPIFIAIVFCLEYTLAFCRILWGWKHEFVAFLLFCAFFCLSLLLLVRLIHPGLYCLCFFLCWTFSFNNGENLTTANNINAFHGGWFTVSSDKRVLLN